MCENKNNRIPLLPITNNILNPSPISSPCSSLSYSPPLPLSSVPNNVFLSDSSMRLDNINENLDPFGSDFPNSLSFSSSSIDKNSLISPLSSSLLASSPFSRKHRQTLQRLSRCPPVVVTVLAL